MGSGTEPADVGLDHPASGLGSDSRAEDAVGLVGREPLAMVLATAGERMTGRPPELNRRAVEFDAGSSHGDDPGRGSGCSG